MRRVGGRGRGGGEGQGNRNSLCQISHGRGGDGGWGGRGLGGRGLGGRGGRGLGGRGLGGRGLGGRGLGGRGLGGGEGGGGEGFGGLGGPGGGEGAGLGGGGDGQGSGNSLCHWTQGGGGDAGRRVSVRFQMDGSVTLRSRMPVRPLERPRRRRRDPACCSAPPLAGPALSCAAATSPGPDSTAVAGWVGGWEAEGYQCVVVSGCGWAGRSRQPHIDSVVG